MTTEVLTEIKLAPAEHAALNAQAANYRSILRYLKAGGFDEFLKDKNMAPVDLLASPEDMTGGEKIMLFVKSLADECVKMNEKLKGLSESFLDTSIALSKEKRKNLEKKGFGKWLLSLFWI